jgi:UDP-N-acetyl-D-glucosamine dehydrogenase
MIKPTREHAHWAGTRSVDWNRETLERFDVAVIATNHANVNYAELGQWARCIVDTRNAMASVRTPAGLVLKA